jgi:hypothetical protein
MTATEAERTKQLLAAIPQPLARALKKRLIDDGLTYLAWLRQRIEAYVNAHGGKAP